MVGDVNLFLKGSPEDADFEAEVEVMVAGLYGLSHLSDLHPYYFLALPFLSLL
jgi:hypothetical protein